MSRSRTRRPVFLSAVILVVLLGSVLIGSTFAGNVSYNEPMETLKGESYNVDLKYTRTRGSKTYLSMLDENNRKAFQEGMFWSPNRTEIVYLQLTNNEAFPVECMPRLDVGLNQFDNMLSYAVIDKLKSTDASQPSSWKAFSDKAALENNNGVSDVLPSNTDPDTRIPCNLCQTNILLGPGESYFLALAIHMDKDASSKYRNKTLEFEFAVQVNANYKPGVTDPANATDDKKSF